MKTVNYSDNYNKTICIRITDAQYKFLVADSSRLDLSPSEYIRSIIDTLYIKAIIGGVADAYK